MESLVTSSLAVLLVAGAVGIVARFLRVPYTLALVLAGLGLAAFDVPGLNSLHLTPQLLLTVLLPPLLFEASFHLNFQRLRRDLGLVLTLAGPALLVAVSATAGAIYVLAPLVGLPLTVGNAILFGAMISATDPVSVLALFREAGVDRRLYTVVEGESLLNDGVSVVVFLIAGTALGVELHGSTVEEHSNLVVYSVRTFAWMVGAGIGIGVLVGLASSAITRQIDDHLVEIVLTTLVAWGSFLLAEQVHASGVLACVAAGMVHGNIGGHHGMSPATRVAVTDFWEFGAFFANTVIFLLLGIELDAADLASHALPILLGFVAVLTGRSVSVGVTAGIARAMKLPAVPKAWWGVLVWGGLRGGLSMVLAIGLPADYPGRNTLLSLVFGVVAASLLVQGLSMGRFLKWLGVASNQRPEGYDVARLRVVTATRALAELVKQERSGAISSQLARTTREELEATRAENEQRMASLSQADVVNSEQRELRLHLLAVQADAVREAIHGGIVGDEAAGEVLAEIANARDQFGSGH
jgi:monovalent cation:H+ antiporter, CPA1 family